MLLLVDTLANVPFFSGFIPNATQIQQPMDVAVFRPFKQLVEKRMKAASYGPENEQITINNFHQILVPCYMQAMTPKTIISGFRKAGIQPFNMDNVDLTAVEGLEHRQTAFWPDEGQIINDLRSMGTNTDKPVTVQTHVQTDHSGDIEESKYIHAESIRTYEAGRSYDLELTQISRAHMEEHKA